MIQLDFSKNFNFEVLTLECMTNIINFMFLSCHEDVMKKYGIYGFTFSYIFTQGFDIVYFKSMYTDTHILILEHFDTDHTVTSL